MDTLNITKSPDPARGSSGSRVGLGFKDQGTQ